MKLATLLNLITLLAHFARTQDIHLLNNGKPAKSPRVTRSLNKPSAIYYIIQPPIPLRSLTDVTGNTTEGNASPKLAPVYCIDENNPLIDDKIIKITDEDICTDKITKSYVVGQKINSNVQIDVSTNVPAFDSLFIERSDSPYDLNIPSKDNEEPNSDVFNTGGIISKCDDSDKDLTQYPKRETSRDSTNDIRKYDCIKSIEHETQAQYSLEEFQNLTHAVDAAESTGTIKTSRIRNKDLCYFCDTKVLNFARHLMRHHIAEPEVQEILSYPTKSCKRKSLITALRKKGNYLTNVKNCVKPMKKGKLSPQNDYLPCDKCLGFYARKHLWKHKKTCEPSSATSNTQVDSQNFIVRNLNVNIRLKKEVFPKMRPDRVSLEAKTDPLICAYGAQCYLNPREKQSVNITSRKMRALAKLLMEIRRLKPIITNLTECLKPEYYDVIVTAAKNISGYNKQTQRYNNPTFALNLSTSLRKCCKIANMTALKSGVIEDDFNKFVRIFNANWLRDVSRQAGSDVTLKKFNKITLATLVTDLRAIKNRLSDKAKIAASKLVKTDTHDLVAYNTLLETVYCRVFLLNGRPTKELQKLLLSAYQDCVDNIDCEIFESNISSTEKMLMKSFKRIIAIDKTGRGHSVLLTDEIRKDINLLISVRHNYISDGNVYLFATPGSEVPLCGYKVLEKYAKSCGAKNPHAVTSTKLRRYLATLTQMLSLNECDIDQLANFMGHAQSEHEKNSTLPDDLNKIAKISKLLLLMEDSNADIHKGKALDEIELDLEEDLLHKVIDSNDDNENFIEYDDIIPIEQPIEGTVSKTTDPLKATNNYDASNKVLITIKKKRNLVRWTAQQKSVVLKFFSKHVKCKRAPKRDECEELKTRYPDILHNKDWLKIKVYIQNAYTKKFK